MLNLAWLGLGTVIGFVGGWGLGKYMDWAEARSQDAYLTRMRKALDKEDR